MLDNGKASNVAQQVLQGRGIAAMAHIDVWRENQFLLRPTVVAVLSLELRSTAKLAKDVHTLEEYRKVNLHLVIVERLKVVVLVEIELNACTRGLPSSYNEPSHAFR